MAWREGDLGTWGPMPNSVQKASNFESNCCLSKLDNCFLMFRSKSSWQRTYAPPTCTWLSRHSVTVLQNVLLNKDVRQKENLFKFHPKNNSLHRSKKRARKTYFLRGFYIGQIHLRGLQTGNIFRLFLVTRAYCWYMIQTAWVFGGTFRRFSSLILIENMSTGHPDLSSRIWVR